MIMFIFDLIHFYEGLSFRIKGTSFRVIVESEEQVEISFTRLWDPSLQGKQVPLNIDKRYSIKSYLCICLWFRFIVMMTSIYTWCFRFIMLRDSPGFYTYAIYEHLKEWPPFNLPQTRIVFKLRKDKYTILPFKFSFFLDCFSLVIVSLS